MEQTSSLAQKDPIESASAGDQFKFIVPQLPDFPTEVDGSYSCGELLEMSSFGSCFQPSSPLCYFPAFQVLKVIFHAKDKAPWLPAVALPLRLEQLHLLGFVVIKCRGSSWHCLLPSVCDSYRKQGLVFHGEPAQCLAAASRASALRMPGEIWG